MKAISVSRRRVIATTLSAPALFGIQVPVALAQQSSPPVRDFVRFPALTNVRLAPDGKSILAIRPVNGRRNLTIYDVATRKVTVITSYRDVDVDDAYWINSNRIVFSVFDLTRGGGEQIYGGNLYAIDRDASDYRELAGTDRAKLAYGVFLSRIREGGKWTDDIIVSIGSFQARGRLATNLYRLNTRSRVATVVTLGGPGLVRRWVVDRHYVPRAALSVDADEVSRVHYRDDANTPWRVVAQFNIDESAKEIVPLAFDGAGVLYVAAKIGRDNDAIYRFDTKSMTIDPEPVFALNGFDLESGLLFGNDDYSVIGVRYEAERPSVAYVDEDWRRLQGSIDQALQGRVNRLSGSISDKNTPILVDSYSDQDAGRYLLFDQQKRQLEQIASARPWLDGIPMAKTEFFRYKARDGLSIPAQLTIPSGAQRKNLPLVVLHYGGPWARAIHWGFDSRVQFLASRGYAVFMPAPRSSTGFGLRHYLAGFKQWGLAMQDDVTDGVRALIGSGVVDPKRVCIAGASYGGYLAMMALVKEPDLFRCAVNWVGVTDPELMFTVQWSDTNELGLSQKFMDLAVGEPGKMREQFRQTSPLKRAAEIKQPVLMAYGGLDFRVPVIHGERLRDALRAHNPNVEWILYGEEGHGWVKEENEIDFWTRVEAFLAKHLAPTN